MPVISGSDSRSGYLSLPPRVQLRERDSATGSYPTIARTGDPDFAGNKPVKFDDSRTVIFSDNVTVSYPTLLQPTGLGLKYISGSLATPNSGSDILATGTVRKGVADQFAFFDNSESIGPFREHLRVLPNEGSFYLTGTDPNVLPGFSSRLSSKTIIKIPMTVMTESSVYWSTGSVPNALGTNQGVNSGLSYFNFSTGKWDVVGVDASTTTGSAVDYINSDINIRKNSYLATAGGNTTTAFAAGFPSSYLLDFQALSGYPCSTFGFPSAEKYDSLDGQKLQMSNYIDKPFAIEKVIFVWTGSLDLKSFDPDVNASTVLSPHRATFGILCNFRNNQTTSIDEEFIYLQQDGLGVTTITETVQYDGGQQKDIIGFARMQGLQQSSTIDDLDDKQKCEFTFEKTSDGPGGGITGSFSLEFTANTPGRVLSSSMIYSLSSIRRSNPSSPDQYQFHHWGGGRTGYGLDIDSAERSLIKPFVGQKITSSSNTSATFDNTVFKTNDPLLNQFESPYVIFPQDELIFFASNQPKDGGGLVGNEEEHLYASQYRWDFAPGESYVLLIGSQIRDGKEFHDTSNQPLNSDAIHEALHFDNPTVDQFQVEALKSYTGSYIDDIVSGDFNAGTRGVVGSVAAGTQGLTGSLIRGVRVTDRGERFYDTLLPSFYDYYTNPNTGVRAPVSIAGGVVPVSILSPLVQYTDDMQPPAFPYRDVTKLTGTVAQEWLFSYPFEQKYEGLERNINSNDNKRFGDSVGVSPGTLVLSYFVTESNRVFLTNEAGDISDRPLFDSPVAKKFLFGFGDGFLSQSNVNSSSYFPNSPSLTLSDTVSSQINTLTDPIIRGWKYGVKNALPEFSSLITRYDRYGQFRDMLEQRPDSRFSTGETITDSPVIIRFVDPASGNRASSPVSSSNKSEFATSSLPYFDGTARN